MKNLKPTENDKAERMFPQPAKPIAVQIFDTGSPAHLFLVTVADPTKRAQVAEACSSAGRCEISLDSHHTFYLHVLQTYSKDQLPTVAAAVEAIQL